MEFCPVLELLRDSALRIYVDSILDLLITSQSPGVKERYVDLYEKPELLFFVSDSAVPYAFPLDPHLQTRHPEGSADVADWAASRAKALGAEWLKYLTTGKNAKGFGTFLTTPME